MKRKTSDNEIEIINNGIAGKLPRLCNTNPQLNDSKYQTVNSNGNKRNATATTTDSEEGSHKKLKVSRLVENETDESSATILPSLYHIWKPSDLQLPLPMDDSDVHPSYNNFNYWKDVLPSLPELNMGP